LLVKAEKASTRCRALVKGWGRKHKSTARSNSAWALTSAGGMESGSYKSASNAVFVGQTSGLSVSAASRGVAAYRIPARAPWDWDRRLC
jgi:hypothetical protein